MYRLYVDEVGTDSLTNLEVDRHRYLSLTGVAMLVSDARDRLEPALNLLKANVFNHDPDAPIILHRKDIMGGKGPFQRIRSDVAFRTTFDAALMPIIADTPYWVITALIDKLWMTQQDHWAMTHPYHYLMQILVEKYTQFLERKGVVGDIMPESRDAKDRHLINAYAQFRVSGTEYVGSERICAAIPSKHLKFRKKSDNVAGLQLCDLLAHPSHIYIRCRMKHEVELGPFSTQVCEHLKLAKYDRSWSGRIAGYGYKHLPA